MSENLRRPIGRAESIPGIGEDAWGWIALWAGAAAVAGLAAATVDPIVDLGPGAVVFAGAGAASAASLAVAASLRLAAPALAKWRGAKPSAGGDPMFREFAAAFAAQLARLDKKLDAAIADAGVRGRVGGPGAELDRDGLARAVERLAEEQRAFFARVEAEADDAARRSAAHAETWGDSVLRRVAGLGDEMARLGQAVAEGGRRQDEFQDKVFGIFRARDADKALRQLDAEASDLFDKLFYVDGRGQDTAEAWRADYAEWRSRIAGFWDIVRGYRTGMDQPFAVTEFDVAHAGGVPQTGLFATEDMRRRFKMLVLINERHVKFREDAFSFNEKKGAPPGPGETSSPPARPHRVAAA